MEDVHAFHVRPDLSDFLRHYILGNSGVATQFPESHFNPNPTVKFKFYCGILI